MEPKLTIELVPASTWYNNVRAHVPRKTWDVLRKHFYQLAHYRCQICGGQGAKHPVECHEIWEYDDERHIQTLKGLITLCPDCHQCKHIGFASRIGRLNYCVRHLMDVNEMTRMQAERMVSDAFNLWNTRSQFDWTVDMGILPSLLTAAVSSKPATK